MFQADALLSKLHGQTDGNSPKGLLVTDDIASFIAVMNRSCPGTTKTIQNGIYLYSTDPDSFFIGTTAIGIPCGTYLIIKVKSLPRAGQTISIANKEYEVFSIGAISVLLTVR